MRLPRIPLIAASFLQVANRMPANDEALKRKLVEEVEEAYLTVPFATLVDLWEEPETQRDKRDLPKGGRFVVCRALWAWIVAQHGVPPGRRQLAPKSSSLNSCSSSSYDPETFEEAIRLKFADLPTTMVGCLSESLRCFASFPEGILGPIMGPFLGCQFWAH